MADANNFKKLMPLGMALLALLFGYLAYDQIQLLVSGWRWGINGFILFKIGWRALLLVALTLGAAIVPTIYCLQKLGWLRSDGRWRKKQKPRC